MLEAVPANKEEVRRLLAEYRVSLDKEVRDKLVLTHLGLVRRLCWRFRGLGEPLEDLYQVGTIGLLKAIEKYDESKGDDFIAFAIPGILGEVMNYLRDHGWAMKVPRKLQRNRVLVERVVDYLAQRLRRWPTVSEIAREAGLVEEEVYEVFDLQRLSKPLSLDGEPESRAGGPVPLAERVGKEDAELESLADRVTLQKASRLLDQRQQMILYLKFYRGLTQAEIAERLGISQMHVSRLQRDAIEKLRAAVSDLAT